eukprot:969124-Pleurochrysis_carterae.AAC.1
MTLVPNAWRGPERRARTKVRMTRATRTVRPTGGTEGVGDAQRHPGRAPSSMYRRTGSRCQQRPIADRRKARSHSW